MAQNADHGNLVKTVDCAQPKGIGESLECGKEVYAKTGKDPKNYDIQHEVDPKSCYITQAACRHADIGCDKKIVPKAPGDRER